MASNSKRLLLWRLAILACASLAASTLSLAQDSTSLVLPQSDIRLLANRVLKNAGKADCKPGSCKILVANFVLPSGNTSQLGSRLADAFSGELATQQSDISMIERSELQIYLQRERIPSKFLSNDDAVRWLAAQLGATAVVRGMTEDWGDSIRLRVTLLSAHKEKQAPTEEFTFPSSRELKDALAPAEAFPKEIPRADPSIPLIAKASPGGVAPPRCQYCPNPDYTNPARKVKYPGVLLLQVVITEGGTVSHIAILRGLPFGLNQQAIQAVRQWRFQPPMRGSEPLACEVMIELNFHLY
jgi:TonB family protein